MTDPDAYRRVQRLAWLMDESIRLPGGRRIGLDGLLGIVPGLGDGAGLLVSGYMLLEARRLGVPGRVLGRMTWNLLVDAAVGTIPIAGDLFDFAWKANSRNLELIRRHVEAAGVDRPR